MHHVFKSLQIIGLEQLDEYATHINTDSSDTESKSLVDSDPSPLKAPIFNINKIFLIIVFNCNLFYYCDINHFL